MRNFRRCEAAVIVENRMKPDFFESAVFIPFGRQHGVTILSRGIFLPIKLINVTSPCEGFFANTKKDIPSGVK
jgi:hypothetical protein